MCNQKRGQSDITEEGRDKKQPRNGTQVSKIQEFVEMFVFFGVDYLMFYLKEGYDFKSVFFHI